MGYDPTQQVPPPQGYSPPTYGVSQQPTYVQPPMPQAYTPPPPAPATYTQYSSAPPAPTAAAGSDFAAFWRRLGLAGQTAGVGGLVLFICFIFPWITSPNFANLEDTSTDTHSGFGAASNGARVFFTGKSATLFPQLWLVFLGALALVALAWLIGQHRISSRLATLSIIAISGLSFLLELCLVIQTSSLQDSLHNPEKTYYGTEWGFWLAVLTTLAVLGLAIFALVQERKALNPLAANPYQQPAGYSGAPPIYQGSQPAAYPLPQAYPVPQAPTYQYPSAPPPAYPAPNQPPPPPYPGQ
jgi:hypothetical protein